MISNRITLLVIYTSMYCVRIHLLRERRAVRTLDQVSRDVTVNFYRNKSERFFSPDPHDRLPSRSDISKAF